MKGSAARLRWFCLLLVAPPLLAVVVAVLLAQSDWFLRRAVPNYVAMLNNEFSIRDKPCDVLVYGDSTALTGLKPWIIQQDTGARTCNVSQTKGVVGVTGLDSLRQYLARNPPPQVLVIAFSPEDWRPIRNWGETAYVEGMLEVVRHENAAVILRKFGTHPAEVFGFTTFIFKSAIAAALHRGPMPTAKQPVAREGQMTLPSPPERTCLNQDAMNMKTFPEAVMPQPEFIRAVRAEFAPRAGVLLLISPALPECDALGGFYRSMLDPLLDAPITTQPIGDYNDLDRHFTAAGADTVSHSTAAIISRHLHGSTIPAGAEHAF